MAENRICLLLFLDQELAALLNITATSQRSIRHIGDVFIVVQKLIGIKDLDRSCWKKELSGRTSTGVLGNWSECPSAQMNETVHHGLGFEIEGCQARGAFSLKENS